MSDTNVTARERLLYHYGIPEALVNDFAQEVRVLDVPPTHQHTVCPECGHQLDDVEHETVDCASMNDVAREVLCRVFDDGADKGMDEWQDFYAKGGWFWWGRALGAFIRGRLNDMAKDGSDVRLLNERLSRLYEINKELRDAAPLRLDRVTLAKIIHETFEVHADCINLTATNNALEVADAIIALLAERGHVIGAPIIMDPYVPDTRTAVREAKTNWCAFTHRHGLDAKQVAAIDQLAALARKADPMRSDAPIVNGEPQTHCGDCGTAMLWTSEQKEAWMCPLCCHRRLRTERQEGESTGYATGVRAARRSPLNPVEKCPMCSSTAIHEESVRAALTWGGARDGEIPFTTDTNATHHITKCENCGEQFYTAKQSREVDSQILYALYADWQRLEAYMRRTITGDSAR